MCSPAGLAPGSSFRPNCGPADLAAAAERLRGSVAEPVIQTFAGVAATISLGVVSVPLSGSEPIEYDVLLKTSDQALYRAEANGRNRVEAGTLSLAVAAG